jgi:hypothetical protein
MIREPAPESNVIPMEEWSNGAMECCRAENHYSTYFAIICSIPAITSALVTAAMQRKSSGHSRKKQGLHST